MRTHLPSTLVVFCLCVLFFPCQLVWGQFDGPHLISKPFVSNLISMDNVDFDGDGDIDIVSISVGNKGMVWYENQGDNTFSNQQVIGDMPNTIQYSKLVDLNKDGYMDVILFEEDLNTNTIEVDRQIVYYLQNEQGGLDSPKLITTIEYTQTNINTEINTFDKEGDGDLDILLIFLQPGNNKLFWYENDGQNNFAEAKIIDDSVDNLFSGIFIEDIDNDGDLDFTAYFSDASKVISYTNNGENGFVEQKVFTAGELLNETSASLSHHIRVYGVEDFNNDGIKDILAMVNYKFIVWFKGEENGLFEAPSFVFESNYSFDTSDVSIMDVDNNGTKDILFKSYRTIWWLNNTMEENLGNLIEIQTFTSPNILAPLEGYFTNQDIDKDGDLDFLLIGIQKIRIYENKEGGVFSNIHLLETEHPITYTSIDDFDNNGFLDILVYHSKTESIWKYAISKNEELEAPSLLIQSEVNHPVSTLTADLNGDGLLDILSLSMRENQIVWYQNEGNGTFGNQQIIRKRGESDWSIKDNIGVQTIGLEAVDLDNDQYLDIVYSDKNGLSETLLWQKNDGTGHFAAPIIIEDGATHQYEEMHDNMDEVRSITSRDIDKDGDTDLIVNWSYQTTLYQNEGNGTFSNVFSIKEEYVGATKVVDLNQDGYDDIITFDNYLSWYQNEGDGFFSKQAFFPSSTLWSNPYSYLSAIADLDRDGDLDIVLCHFNDWDINWYENNGNGHWQAEHELDATGLIAGVTTLQVADLDFDGNQDILIVTGEEGITWLRNEGTGTFVNTPQTPLTYLPTFFFHSDFADLDDDGDLDLVTEFPWYNQIVWFENTILTTNIKTFNSLPFIHIYPNPFSHHTTIEVKNLPQENHQLQLINILGRKVRELDLKEGKAVLQRGDLESGLYLVRVLEEGNGRILGNGKIIVN